MSSLYDLFDKSLIRSLLSC